MAMLVWTSLGGWQKGCNHTWNSMDVLRNSAQLHKEDLLPVIVCHTLLQKDLN